MVEVCGKASTGEGGRMEVSVDRRDKKPHPTGEP
jgi:hypothetical protein